MTNWIPISSPPPVGRPVMLCVLNMLTNKLHWYPKGQLMRNNLWRVNSDYGPGYLRRDLIPVAWTACPKLPTLEELACLAQPNS